LARLDSVLLAIVSGESFRPLADSLILRLHSSDLGACGLLLACLDSVLLAIVSGESLLPFLNFDSFLFVSSE
jgi:hypothetical protein